MPDQQKLVYDWNLIGNSEPLAKKPVLLDDETLRDGLQSPTVSDPSIDDKIHLMHLMEDLGIQMLDIGLPGAGPRAYNDTLALATEIARSRMKIRPNCAARTTIQDIDPIIDIAEKTGVVIDAATFLGSPPRRSCDVRNGRYDSSLSGNHQEALYDGHQLRFPSYRADRHCWPCDARRCELAGEICDRRGGETIRRRDHDQLARSQRSGLECH